MFALKIVVLSAYKLKSNLKISQLITELFVNRRTIYSAITIKYHTFATVVVNIS